MANFSNSCFWFINNPTNFYRGIQEAINSVEQDGIYASDQMFVYSRNLSFMGDEKLMGAYHEYANSTVEKGILWRTAVLAWAAKHCLNLEGDFVECACMHGTTALILCKYLDFQSQEKTYHLYDSFDYDEPPKGLSHPRGHDLFDLVVGRFSCYPNVRVVKGMVPDVINENFPEKISMLHLDINSASAEIGALECWFDKVVSGGLIILDDYGWKAYRAQKDAHDIFFSKRKYDVLELPTGQGMVLKR